VEKRVLGATGIQVSVLAFGAGPVPAVMTSGDVSSQIEVVQTAIDSGINWFDTAAGYGDGKSESALGTAIAELGAGERVHVATKVRLSEDKLHDIPGAVHASVEASLKRLRLNRVTLLQLHNSITPNRGDEPTSVTPTDVLGAVRDAFERLKSEGLVRHVGLTGIGSAESMRQVIRSGAFETIQIPYNLLNPSAGRTMPASFAETNYGNVIADCAEMKMGVFAIRVLAGGALAGNPPSGHTLKTKFFPLDLYQRDLERARAIADALGTTMTPTEAGIRFAISHPSVTSAIVGCSDSQQVRQAVASARRGTLDSATMQKIEPVLSKQIS
jgi:L-galactose dehydrogenase/L-glyceraldehyde 3-phosphate reductase